MNSRLGVTGIAFLFVLATLAACGGGGGNGGSATAPSPNNVAGFAYVLDSGSGQVAGSKVDVSAYTIDASTGALSQATASRHVTTQAGNVAGFAHVSNSDDVSAYGINTSAGALAQIACRLWSPIGRAMSINANAAALAPFAGTTIAAGVFAVPSTVDPSGRFAYVLNYAAENISAYAFDPATGTFSEVEGSPFGAGTSPYSSRFVTVDPSGKFLYVSNLRTVSVYAINSSTDVLSEVADSPFAAGSLPESVRIDSSGKFAYVANSGSGNVSAYSIDASTGALSELEGSPVATGGAPANLTIARATH